MLAGGSKQAVAPDWAEPMGQGQLQAVAPGTGTFSVEGNRQLPVELQPSLSWVSTLRGHPSHGKGHGGWIWHRVAQETPAPREPLWESDKAPAAMNVTGLTLAVPSTRVVSGTAALPRCLEPKPLPCPGQGARAAPGLGAPGRALGDAGETARGYVCYPGFN